ncbi:MAG: hypothetical protein Q9163_002884 [Psora crenata]
MVATGMGSIWSGSIYIDEQGTTIDGLTNSSSSCTVLVDKIARLRFLSIIDLAGIPLHIIAGPSLEVQTANQTAINWFSDILFSTDTDGGSNGAVNEPWWLDPLKQSEYGILLKVVHDHKRGEHGKEATEIVFYAAVDSAKPDLPTPPASSSPAPPNQALSQPQPTSIRLYALPLCSNFIRRTQQLSSLCSPAAELEGQAYFVGDTTVKESMQIKRQRISSLFDDAAKQRKILKGRGGESVAQAMASIDRSAAKHVTPAQTRTASQEEISGVPASHKRSLSRASSMSSFPLDSVRPASRSGGLGQCKRSSLHRVESAVSQHEGSMASETDNTFAEYNKTALAKVIMAGMRLHGLQQKRKVGQVASRTGHSSNALLLAGGEIDHQDGKDEYKLVYHQAYKAALFAFRDRCNLHFISQEAMRDVVDKLLDLFCTGPLSSNFQHHGFSEGHLGQKHEYDGVSDLPGSSALQKAVDGSKSITVTKKRKPGNFHCTDPG